MYISSNTSYARDRARADQALGPNPSTGNMSSRRRTRAEQRAMRTEDERRACAAPTKV
jgi:hypothetical protein